MSRSGVDAQREATHYKNRVLDLLDTFIKKQPASPLIPRLILPLVELVVSAGSDEKQLSDKATGILRSRIGKSKDVPSSIDADQTGEVLRELHIRARKAVSGDVLATLSQCSIYLSRSLIHSQSENSVLDAYRGSLTEFVTRKASRLNTGFFQEFFRRHASVAWGLRDTLLELTANAVNGYRQSQVFQLIQLLLTQLPTTVRALTVYPRAILTLTQADRVNDLLEFMPALRQAVQKAIRRACDGETLTAPHVKDVLKLTLSAVRLTKRVAESQSQVQTAWEPSSWESLSQTLAGSERFKSSTGLQASCKQIAQLASQDTSTKSKGSTKRKVDAIEEDVTASDKKAKRKAKKAKA